MDCKRRCKMGLTSINARLRIYSILPFTVQSDVVVHNLPAEHVNVGQDKEESVLAMNVAIFDVTSQS